MNREPNKHGIPRAHFFLLARLKHIPRSLNTPTFRIQVHQPGCQIRINPYPIPFNVIMDDATLFQLPQLSTSGENRHQRAIIRLNLQSHHLTKEFNALVTQFQVTVPRHHGPPGYFISHRHFVEQFVGIVDSMEETVYAYEGVEGVQMG